MKNVELTSPQEIVVRVDGLFNRRFQSLALGAPTIAKTISENGRNWYLCATPNSEIQNIQNELSLRPALSELIIRQTEFGWSLNLYAASVWLSKFLRRSEDKIRRDLRRPFVTEGGTVHYFVRQMDVNCLVASVAKDQQTVYPLLTSAIKENNFRIIGIWATPEEFRMFWSSHASDPEITILL